ncbi:MAG: hypothetical protein GY939_06595 [Actinomycetia bacterium]|nr:hypothetical protein [Actinomycetes bacterium]
MAVVTHRSFSCICHATCSIEEHGLRAIASYAGTGAYQNTTALATGAA